MKKTLSLGDSATVLGEPTLEFGYGQELQDPRNGLALFGPYDRDHAGRPGNISYGVVGTAEGIARFRRFAETLSQPIVPEHHDPQLWRPFPGFEAAFNANWPTEPAWTYEVNEEVLEKSVHHGDAHRRAYETAGLYFQALRIAKQKDEHFGLFFCVLPDVVYRNCRPHSTVKKRDRTTPRPASDERRLRESGQASLLGDYDTEMYQYSVDFRRQLKARALKYGIPLQIVRETTLRPTDKPGGWGGTRRLTPHSDRAWNLSTAAYYKAGGKPWRLASARDGVCYVGLAFRQTETSTNSRSACSAAQMFLDTGDGVVFKGQEGKWFSPKSKQFHLDASAAEDLLSGVLKRYQELEGKQLTEVFLHSRSSIDEEEFAGYERAVPSGTKVVGIRVRRERGTGIKLYRDGNYPVMRGTLWLHGNNTAFLWGSGFTPATTSYRGTETPVPVRIDLQHGEGDIERIARDIFGLTKLNYNACQVGKNVPITIGFSDKVGEILIGNRAIAEARPQFKYYI